MANPKAETGPEYANRRQLVFQMSLTCPASCRICGYDCGPGRSQTISEDGFRNVLDSCEGLLLNRTVAFTGGEPFVHYELLKRLLKYVKKRLGVNVSVSTNCFWADSAEKTGRILDELQELGLNSLLISVDDYHQEHIDLSRVITVSNVAFERDISLVFQCVETRNSRRIGWYRKRVGIPEIPNRVKWIPIPCDPVGRAARRIPASELQLRWRKQPGFCTMLRGLVVNCDGRLTNCCGSANYFLPFSGNAFQTPLHKLAKKADTDPILNALGAWGGPFLLFDVLADNEMPDYGERAYTSPCHACSVIFQNQRAIDVLKVALTPRYLELLAARLMAQAAYDKWIEDNQRDPLIVLDTGHDDAFPFFEKMNPASG